MFSVSDEKGEAPAQSNFVVPDRAIAVMVLAEHDLPDEQQNRANVAAAEERRQRPREVTKPRQKAVVVAQLPQVATDGVAADASKAAHATLAEHSLSPRNATECTRDDYRPALRRGG